MGTSTLLAASIVILLFSVILHEVMHGLAALYWGDTTAQQAGRLTLNPISHIDPIGTILVPALLALTHSPFLFGWAKPVPIDPFNFRDIRKGELATSAAGIAANLALALLAALLFHLLVSFANTLWLQILIFTSYINLLLAVFNMIPIPPLDGSKILISLLPPKAAAGFAALEQYGMFLLLLLLVSGLFGAVLGPVLILLMHILGLPF